jgi:hypothetical protein
VNYKQLELLNDIKEQFIMAKLHNSQNEYDEALIRFTSFLDALEEAEDKNTAWLTKDVQKAAKAAFRPDLLTEDELESQLLDVKADARV